MSHREHAKGLALAAALVSSASIADAQPVDPALAATRRETIEQALRASSDGDHVRALELAQRAGQLSMTTSLRALIAREAAAMGRWSLALGEGQQCVVEVERDTSIADRDMVLATCRRVVASAQSRVGRIVISMPPDAPAEARVRVAGADLPRAAWGLAYVVTPGSVDVDVSASGYDDFHVSEVVSEGARITVPVTLVARPIAAPQPLPRVAQQQQVPAVIDAQPSIETRLPTVSPSSGPGIAPWIVVGVGALGLGLSGVFYGLGQSAFPACANNRSLGCPDGDEPAYNRYASFRMAAGVSAWVGGAAVVGGFAWWLIARLRGGTTPATASLHIGPNRDGVSIGYATAF